jgi:serine/threonine protein kinase
MIIEIPGYAIEEKLGSGDMTHVYRARHQRLDRLVAIKVMHLGLTLRDEDVSRRFLREAHITANLNHPNIVQVYDVNSLDNLHYIAMEYLDGGDLQKRLRYPITREKLIRLVADVSAALDFAHDRGHIHHNIKPTNILFRQSGEALVADFSIARDISSATQLNQVGTLMGSPNYMSPEQASGKSPDGSTDFYSLTAIVFEMLTGRVPYQGDSPLSIAIKHITEPAPTLPQGLHAVQPFIDKGMAKEPANRFRSGAEMVSMLSDVLGQLTAQEMSRANTFTQLLLNRDEKPPVVTASRASAEPANPVAPTDRMSETEKEVTVDTVVADRPGRADPKTVVVSERQEPVIGGMFGWQHGAENVVVSNRHKASAPETPVPPQATTAKAVDEPPKKGGILKVLGVVSALVMLGLLVTVFVSMQRNASEIESRNAAQAAENLRLAMVAKEQAEANAKAEAQKRAAAEAVANAETEKRAAAEAVANAEAEKRAAAEAVAKAEAEKRAAAEAKEREDAERRARFGQLTLDIDPPSATAILPGINSNYTPGMTLEIGNYKLIVKAPGYLNWEGTFNMQPGACCPGTIKLERDLQAEAGARELVGTEEGDAPENAVASVQAASVDARAKPYMLVEAGGGVLLQPKTGLEWTQSDNGSDINWGSAGAYCAGKGSGWRLPSSAELQSLYDASGAVSTSCGSDTCWVSPLFRLTGPVGWSSEADAASEAWGVYLVNGDRYSGSASIKFNARALCVRGS